MKERLVDQKKGQGDHHQLPSQVKWTQYEEISLIYYQANFKNIFPPLSPPTSSWLNFTPDFCTSSPPVV